MLARFTILFIPFLSNIFAQPIAYSVDTVAGSDPSSDGGIAANALLEDVRGVAVDPSGNVYYADTARHRVFRISTSGLLTLFAGAGQPGFSGDGGPADLADLNQPYGLAADSFGNVYIADLQNARVRRVTPDGHIQTFAGGGSLSPSPTPTLATGVSLKMPRNVALDASGNLYLSDFQDHRVFRISPDGRLVLFAGNGSAGPAADSLPALNATLSYPAGLYASPSGDLFIADSGNHAIRKINSGVITTLRIPASSAFLNLPTGISGDSAGNLYVASGGFDQAIRISPSGAATVVARGARDIAVDSTGVLYLASGAFLRKLAPSGQLITLAGVTGQFRGEGTPALQALLSSPSDVKPAPNGDLLIADTANHRIRRIANGIITTVAGDGEPGFRGDLGVSQAARLSSPHGIALDPAGNIFIADTDNHRVRRIAPNGQITTVAGTGVPGVSAGIREAFQSQLNAPSAVAIDASGLLHIADTGNHRVCRITPNGYLIPVAGSGQRGFSGDGLGGLNGQLDTPRGIAFDLQDNLYIADSGNHRVRRLAFTGFLSTVAGNGLPGFGGDGKTALEASLNFPTSIAIGGSSLFIADPGNQRIRRVTPDGLIDSVAGFGQRGFSGDRGLALNAKFDEPSGLFLDLAGNIYIADRQNQRIRKLTPGAAVQPPPAVELLPDLRVSHGSTLEITPIAPGMVLSIQAPGIGPATPVSGKPGPTGALDTTAGDTQVRFDGRPAPILYAQQNLINVQAPYRLTGPTTQIEIVRGGQTRGLATMNVTAWMPGIFTSAGGAGPATALNDDFTLNSELNPATPGSTVVFYATGEGLTDPPGVEGRLTDPPYPVPLAPVQVSIGSQPAEIVSMASGATSPGVLQVIIRIPAKAISGTQSLTLTTGGAQSQRNVTLFIR